MVYYEGNMKINKVLIIRFSSFGDIVQCTSVIDLIRQHSPEAQVDWVTRIEFVNLVKLNHNVNQVWGFDRKLGLWGLIKFALELKKQKYTHVYDAHNNVRSSILKLFLYNPFVQKPYWITRSKNRIKRLLLFTFRINLLDKPFRSMKSFRDPLLAWGLVPDGANKVVTWDYPVETLQKTKVYVEKTKIVLVPSAAWEMKRWPVEHFQKLIQIMPKHEFIILGGKEDTFCEDIKAVAPERVENLAGKLSLVESCALVSQSKIVISADTGLLHVADVMGISGLSLMGPTAFGFTTGKQIKTMEVDLACRPCTKDGRGKCSQDVYKKCLVNITPDHVKSEILKLLGE